MLSITGLSPAEGEKLVDVNTSIEFTIVDDNTGVDISSLIVEINGFRALEGINFKTGFDGVNSEVTPDDDDYIIIIDPESDFAIGTIVSVKIQVKNLDGNFFNQTYVFKTIPNEPLLTDSSPENGDVLTTPQVIFLEFQDTLDGLDLDSINIEINELSYIENGSISSEPNGALTLITEIDDGVAIRIDPVEPLRDGNYTINYSVSDTTAHTLTGQIKFEVLNEKVILPAVFPQTGFIGFFQGIKRASNLGSGEAVKIEWNTPASRMYKSEVFLLIYENPHRLELFENEPKYMAHSDISQANIIGLTPGQTLSFAVRAMETYKDIFDLDGMTEVSTGLYLVPEPAIITEAVSNSDRIIKVNSISGFPSNGLLLIGREVVRYNDISDEQNAFLIPTNGRGLNDTTPGIYIPGDTVKLFTKCQDDNTVIIMSTPHYVDGYESGRELQYTGLVVTDYEDNDAIVFQGYDFCGYHNAMPQQVLHGKNDCGSYLGGEFNGFRGMDLYEQMLNREEVLLDNVGEPIILLKRIWDGKICSCMDPRKMHPKIRSCPECYGTGFIGGFTQFINLRREDRRTMVKFNEAVEDLNLGATEHLNQAFEPSCWTLPMPAIRDRDLIVRFDLTDDVEFIYEVLNVSREKLMMRKFGRQKLEIKRLDKTDIVYAFPFVFSS